MKTSKRISVIIMALAMVLSLCVNVFATASSHDTTYSITIKPNSTDNATHVYEAYQIFSGTAANVSDAVELANIEWGSSISFAKDGTVDPAKQVDYLAFVKKLNELDGFSDWVSDNSVDTSNLTAQNLADFLSNSAVNKSPVATNAERDKNTVAMAFADIIVDYLVSPVGTSTQEGNKYVIKNLPSGYYFVKDSDTGFSEPSEDQRGAFTDYILEVVGNNVEVEEKASVPSLEKVIMDEDVTKDPADHAEIELQENQAAIGESVNYKLKLHIPEDIERYTNDYWYIISDEFSGGLTFNGKDSIKITMGNDPDTVSFTDYTLKVYKKVDPSVDLDNETVPADGWLNITSSFNPDTYDTEGTDTKIVITFNNFKKFVDDNNTTLKPGDPIEITYSATVNQDAVITDEGNPNTARLQYSNDPNKDYSGTPNPDDDHPMGKTPESKVITYTMALKLKKIDDKGNKLEEGATFEITGDALKTALVNEKVYVPDSNGAYYLLKDGTYTQDVPEWAGGKYSNDDYETNHQKYKLEEVITKKSYREGIRTTGEIKNGFIEFKGLAAGEYTIKEIKAPNGYNLLKDDIKVTVKATDMDEHGCTWSVTATMGTDKITFTQQGDEYLWQADIVNKQGIQLPETGGVGTTIFYILGGGLLIAALAILVSKILSSSKTKSAKAVRATENI